MGTSFQIVQQLPCSLVSSRDVMVQPRGSGLNPEVRREAWALWALPFVLFWFTKLPMVPLTITQDLSASPGGDVGGLGHDVLLGGSLLPCEFLQDPPCTVSLVVCPLSVPCSVQRWHQNSHTTSGSMS